MPDDHHPLMPRRNPEDIDLGAIKADLEFPIKQVTRSRNVQGLSPFYTMVGSAAIVIAWIELSGGTACEPRNQAKSPTLIRNVGVWCKPGYAKKRAAPRGPPRFLLREIYSKPASAGSSDPGPATTRPCRGFALNAAFTGSSDLIPQRYSPI
jgi:hypothetical protein